MGLRGWMATERPCFVPVSVHIGRVDWLVDRGPRSEMYTFRTGYSGGGREILNSWGAAM
jgi:hypothetical protein